MMIYITVCECEDEEYTILSTEPPTKKFRFEEYYEVDVNTAFDLYVYLTADPVTTVSEDNYNNIVESLVCDFRIHENKVENR